MSFVDFIVVYLSFSDFVLDTTVFCKRFFVILFLLIIHKNTECIFCQMLAKLLVDVQS